MFLIPIHSLGTGQKAGKHLGRVTCSWQGKHTGTHIHACMHTLTPRGHLASPVHLTCMSLDWGGTDIPGRNPIYCLSLVRSDLACLIREPLNWCVSRSTNEPEGDGQATAAFTSICLQLAHLYPPHFTHKSLTLSFSLVLWLISLNLHAIICPQCNQTERCTYVFAPQLTLAGHFRPTHVKWKQLQALWPAASPYPSAAHWWMDG